jgi:2,3-bisphosphoglycerate-independent phosphoglycerate mutase
VKKARVHALLDGRDVPETSALEYVDRLEPVLASSRALAGLRASPPAAGA